jgi:NMD protein affecting ribosome stability and mRNA decay
MIREGKCQQCGKPREDLARKYCESCLVDGRRRNQKWRANGDVNA